MTIRKISAIGMGCVIIIILFHDRRGTRTMEAVQIGTSTPPALIPTSVAIVLPRSEFENLPDHSPQSLRAAITSNFQSRSSVVSNTPVRPPRELQDPAARVALSLVGVDPSAEVYWAEAIFDSGLSNQEREDLMEDLNEVGLSDPRRPSPEDMQLIANRIPIIEEVALLAASEGDTFMLSHLGEAYKDLCNLLYGVGPQ